MSEQFVKKMGKTNLFLSVREMRQCFAILMQKSFVMEIPVNSQHQNHRPKQFPTNKDMVEKLLQTKIYQTQYCRHRLFILNYWCSSNLL